MALRDEQAPIFPVPFKNLLGGKWVNGDTIGVRDGAVTRKKEGKEGQKRQRVQAVTRRFGADITDCRIEIFVVATSANP